MFPVEAVCAGSPSRVDTNSDPADRRYMMMRILVLAVFALLVSVPVASAGKASPSSPTLVVSPSAPVVGDNLVFSGCGYPADGYPKIKETGIEVLYPSGVVRSLSLSIDANGCFSTATDGTPFPASEAGTYTASMFQYPHLSHSSSLVFAVS